MALEILGYTMAGYMLDWRGWSYFPRKSTVRVLVIVFNFFYKSEKTFGDGKKW